MYMKHIYKKLDFKSPADFQQVSGPWKIMQKIP